MRTRQQLSIIRRTTLFAGAVAALLSTSLALLLMVVMQHVATRWLSEEVAAAGRRVVTQIEHGDVVADPLASHSSRVVQVVDERGRVVASTPQLKGRPPMAAFTPSGRQATTSVVCGGVFRDDCDVVVAQRARHGQADWIVYSASPAIPPWVDAQLAAAMIGGALLLTVGITALGHRVAAVSLRPVTAMRAELDSINATCPDRRVPVPPSADEIHDLAGSVNETLSRLEAALRQQRQFVSDASHDLRSPITAMRTEVEDALAAPGETNVTELGSHLLHSLDRLGGIVHDLLIMAALDSGVSLPPERVDLAQFVVGECAIRRPKKTIECSLQPGVRVEIDRGRLCRLLTNLVDNAMRHAESVVTITVRREPGDGPEDGRFPNGVAVLEVLDDGAGIEPQQREHVFGRFTRLDAARTRDRGGSGLGLPIARQIAEMAGGTLGIEDSPRGARFVLRLPAAADAAKPAGSSAVQDQPITARGSR
ncbi:HAMP domain-containing histidine kinase [Microbispora sp. RL4-1S]|uniref:histidine kinase n=1 Tax=Microbispora oryzae TaxID=2806554 RepID=A0A940WHB0_9ACTN|nr:HAMP domain-containing sensor histidine kinase [Microbispora oryzae]MBP2705526.1 HAMP domain-containing histidine kinase [Microbispora oryzae]